jgi:hypothetical protein
VEGHLRERPPESQIHLHRAFVETRSKPPMTTTIKARIRPQLLSRWLFRDLYAMRLARSKCTTAPVGCSS